jgi:hypothetical protein
MQSSSSKPWFVFWFCWVITGGTGFAAQSFTFTTLAGGTAGTNDGANNSAQFYFPSGITVDHQGNLFVSDTSNNTIRKVTPVGTNWVVTTIAGFPAFGADGNTNDGVGPDARFWRPNGLAVDAHDPQDQSEWHELDRNHDRGPR